MTEELKAKLKKIQALAERGVGGEKESAQKKLAQLLFDNDLTEEDLEEEKERYYLFSYSGGTYKSRLLQQVMYKVLGHNRDYKFYKTRHTRNKIGIYCTPAQKVEIDLDYEFYCNLFEKEVETLLTAFIQKQDIFPEDVPHETVKPSEMTPEELEEFNKMRAYRNTISKRQRAAGMIEDKEEE